MSTGHFSFSSFSRSLLSNNKNRSRATILLFGGDEGTRQAASGKVSTDTFLFSSFSSPFYQTIKIVAEPRFYCLVEMRGLAKPRREKCPPDTFFFLLFESLLSNNKNRSRATILLFGGDEGTRTPVQYSFHICFSECSLLLSFPLEYSNKQPYFRSSYLNTL